MELHIYTYVYTEFVCVPSAATAAPRPSPSAAQRRAESGTRARQLAGRQEGEPLDIMGRCEHLVFLLFYCGRLILRPSPLAGGNGRLGERCVLIPPARLIRRDFRPYRRGIVDAMLPTSRCWSHFECVIFFYCSFPVCAPCKLTCIYIKIYLHTFQLEND